MSTKIELHPGYVLHTQPFQNSSLLVDLLLLEHGRIRAVAKGARRPNSRTRALLQPFQPLLLSLSGRSELKSLTSVEGSVSSLNLQGTRLFSGLYLNELLVRLLLFNEGHPTLYKAYQESVIGLSGDSDVNAILRRFELSLLDALGYAVNLDSDCHSGLPIEKVGWYLFHPELGFERLMTVMDNKSSNPAVFSGLEITRLRARQFSDRDAAHAARRLTRMALQVHLGSRPLVSRSLFLKQAEKA